MKLAWIFLLILVSLSSYPSLVWAQLAKSRNTLLDSKRVYSDRPKFPDNGAPTGRRKGGTSRDGCTPLNMPITALVPGEEIAEKSKSFLTLTISEYPTFWVYVPDLPLNARFGEFLLQDENDENIYRISLSLPEKASVFGIPLPQISQYTLKTNKNYQWYFKVFCGDPQKISDYYYVKAWVQRVPLTSKLESQLNLAPSTRYTTYAANQLWQDAITNLANLRLNNPDSHILIEDWRLLLKDIGLSELAPVLIMKLEKPQKNVTQSN
ncbi:DUF928 domain-containing protein [Nostoc sp.]|uniref:DUF928 domain-containing protein n=1 Tax=Nostoc sp. TaxID=1180 RepID=UPI002FFCBC59